MMDIGVPVIEVIDTISRQSLHDHLAAALHTIEVQRNAIARLQRVIDERREHFIKVAEAGVQLIEQVRAHDCREVMACEDHEL